MNAHTPIASPYDVLIIGAGISGIGMAAHLAKKCPNRSFAILDRRERLGGTWDLFRYPGLRSDSDMYTLGFEFEPWREERAIARSDKILEYLNRVVDHRDLRRHIQLGRHVVSADWDSQTALWTLTMIDGATVSARFVYLGAGYYDHDAAHDAQLPGLGSFGGKVIHPQFWPEDFDYSGQRVAVIGSGATAVTLVPAMAETAAEVVMVQRTPGWFIPYPAKDALANRLRKLLPERWAYALVRKFNVRTQAFLFQRSRNEPAKVAAMLTGMLKKQLGDAYDPAIYSPPYDPWEQRPCLVPDGDFFKAVRKGKARVVTGAIDTIDQAGVQMADGSHIDADVIVTATGLKLAVMGKIAFRMDGKPINFSDHWYYRDCMFSNVPNLAALFGYLNAGWTLRVDLVSDWLCRMFNQMDAWGRDVVVPVLPPDHDLVEDNPIDKFSSGYLQRGRGLIPKSTAQMPWHLSMDYTEDRKHLRQDPIDDGILRFDRARVVA